MPATHVPYDSTNIYRRSPAGYAGNYDCTEIYGRSHTGYVCTYDCTKLYREGRKGGIQKVALKSLKI